MLGFCQNWLFGQKIRLFWYCALSKFQNIYFNLLTNWTTLIIPGKVLKYPILRLISVTLVVTPVLGFVVIVTTVWWLGGGPEYPECTDPGLKSLGGGGCFSMVVIIFDDFDQQVYTQKFFD